ncbi:11416_t:CDS:2 [Ambispora gerdemannii]|uniref:11416_t:CDS:1 n=1 Tax=Ambispora gerdemannii TaxID=144530 RepID=A0A9N9H3X7_9GLOM|nr:11416_t:CDS:2 [Ambispora gerdemannii]
MEEMLNMGARVLDGGCGPGAWLLEMATNYPDSHFFGVDIESNYPSQIKPRNLNFYQCDLLQLEKLGFEENSFDMVRMSFMRFSLGEKNYAKIVEKMLKLLKPGGYFEISETNPAFPDIGPNTARLIKTFLMSQNADPNLNFEKIFLATEQLINIQQNTWVTKLGPSGGFAGELYLSLLEEFYNDSIAELLSALMGMTLNEYKQFWQQCKTEIIELETKVPLEKIWGQKNDI